MRYRLRAPGPARYRPSPVLPTGLLCLLLASGGCGKSTGPDLTAPAQVRGVGANLSHDTTAIVFWLKSYEADLSHYVLYMGTQPDSLAADSDSLTTTSKSLTGLVIGTTYYFGVTAVDEAGNESVMSRLADVTATNAEWEASLGWSDFQAGAYEDALSHFQAAIVRSGTYAPAYLGEGWCRAFMGALEPARISLQQANTLGLANQHANAGLALVLKEQDSWADAIARAETVLTNDETWALPWRTTIDWRDLRLVIAQCAFRLGDLYFADVQVQVDILDPGNGFDPADPATWIVGGTGYSSYAAALLMKLVELEAALGG